MVPMCDGGGGGNAIPIDLGTTMNPSIFQDIVNGVRGHNNILMVSLAGPFLNRYSNQYGHFKLVAAVF
jgi:hypothetical protein